VRADRIVRGLAALVLLSASMEAQEGAISVRPPRDSALIRARHHVLDGRAAEGRKVIDSVLKTVTPESDLYAEALFWRGALASTASDAERDYRRLLIEAPLAIRAEDALLQLAQLVQARGDRRGASDHLYRYMVTYARSPERPARPRVSLWLVRLLFELDQVGRGCDALRMGRDAIPPENIEMRNQLEAYAPRCAYAEAAAAPVASVDTATPRPAPPVATPPAAPAADRDSTPVTLTIPASTATRGAASYYSVQVAAYDTRDSATRMAELLTERGLEARVDGDAKPFRVRIGRYARRAEAARAAQALKEQGQGGFVTLVSPR
jgi:hypothetical protein